MSRLWSTPAPLRKWRGETARVQGVPAYVVFHDATLREIAARTPTSLQQLGTISGVGENKLAKYGQPILDALADILDRPGRPEHTEPAGQAEQTGHTEPTGQAGQAEPPELDFEPPPEDPDEYGYPDDYFPA